MTRKNEVHGFSGTIEDVLNIWRRHATNWKKRSSPWRPSKGDISVYRKLIKSELPGKVLILGSTPEIRDLVSDITDIVTLVDICPEMIVSMGNLLTVSNFKKEIHIIGNWCKMPFPDSSFDIVVSDCPWWLFSNSNQRVLRDEISRVLSPNGTMVTRSHFCNTKIVGKDLSKIIKESVLGIKINKRNLAGIKEALMLRLLDASTEIKYRRFNTQKVITVVKKELASEQNSTVKNFLSELLSSLVGRVDWTSQSRNEIIKCLKEKFIIEQEVLAKDYADSKLFPILKLRKK